MTHKVFVYGTLRNGEGNHYLLRDSPCLDSNAYLKGKYKMWRSYSVPFLKEYRWGGWAVGEVYEVSPQVLASLDSLEGHPTVYQRELRPTTKGDNVWVYLFRLDVDGYQEAPHFKETGVYEMPRVNER